MKNFYIHISSLIIVVLVFMSSCQHKPNTTIAQALLLAGEHPDSALALLNNMQFSELASLNRQSTLLCIQWHKISRGWMWTKIR